MTAPTESLIIHISRECASALIICRNFAKARELRKQFHSEICSWRNMWRRCFNPEDKSFHNYGARGITVCPDWGQFTNFLRDMGARPSAAHSIDRINSNGNYEPGNCQWATKEQQNNNRRGVHTVELHGWLMTIGEAMKLTGCQIHPKVVRGRILRMGWTVEDALTAPSRQYRSQAT